jgi:lysophospholipase L1-like esterase
VGTIRSKNIFQQKSGTAFIDVYKEMIDDEGKPRTDIFLEDNLHMNKAGYAIWKKAIEPYLVK